MQLVVVRSGLACRSTPTLNGRFPESSTAATGRIQPFRPGGTFEAFGRTARHWTDRSVSSNVLSEGCLPGRQPPAEAENSPKDFQSDAKMIDLDALVAGLELG